MVAPTLRRRSKVRKQGNDSECKMTRRRPSRIVARACAKRDREVHLFPYLDLERKEPDRAGFYGGDQRCKATQRATKQCRRDVVSTQRKILLLQLRRSRTVRHSVMTSQPPKSLPVAAPHIYATRKIRFREISATLTPLPEPRQRRDNLSRTDPIVQPRLQQSNGSLQRAGPCESTRDRGCVYC
jgi:hypothetical protein